MSRTPLGDIMSPLQGSPLSRRLIEPTINEMFGPNTKPHASNARPVPPDPRVQRRQAGDPQGGQVRQRSIRPSQSVGPGDAADGCPDAVDRRPDRPELRAAHGRPLPRGHPRSRCRDARRRHRPLASDRGTRRGVGRTSSPTSTGSRRRGSRERRGEHRDGELALPLAGRASRRKSSTAASASSAGCQSQHSRRTISGVTRFSVGTETRSRQLGEAGSGRLQPRGRLWFATGPPRRGRRPVLRFGDLGQVVGCRGRGSARPATPARCGAACDPPNTGSAVSFSTVSGSAVAALMIAESGRMRPGAMSRAAGDVVAGRPQLAHGGQRAAVAHLVDARRAPPPVPSGRCALRRCAGTRTPVRPIRSCPAPRAPRRWRRAVRRSTSTSSAA